MYITVSGVECTTSKVIMLDDQASQAYKYYLYLTN